MVANKNLLNISAKDHLRGSITSTNLTLPIRLAVFNGIFQSDLTTEEFLFHDGGLQAWYSDWFEEQCQAAANQISVQTHQELLHILNCLQSTSRDTSRIQVATNICAICSSTTPTLGLNPSDAKLNASLTLAARIWSSVAIDSLQHFFIPGYFTRWDSDQCLSDALGKELCPKPQTHETVKLPKVFTAANLEKIAGIQVQWTSNLADHLALKDDDKIVMFFHQASFLELSKKSKMTLLSDDLIDETLLTIALLIPASDSRSRKWFKTKRKGLSLDSKAGLYNAPNASARRIEKFHYWRDRLVILKQAFDDSEPSGIASWWYDDRKKVQWYTFWVAASVLLLTVVFGLIQSVSGVVQAWAAVRALDTLE